MGRIVSKARQLRLAYQVKHARPVTLDEVAQATDIGRATLTRIERDQTERIDFATLAKLCAFYEVGVGDVLEFQPEKSESGD